MSRWTHSLCMRCWKSREGDRMPVSVKEAGEYACCACGAKTTSGIFVRGNPVEFRCKGEHGAEA
jgi:hypothetical protein